MELIRENEVNDDDDPFGMSYPLEESRIQATDSSHLDFSVLQNFDSSRVKDKK